MSLRSTALILSLAILPFGLSCSRRAPASRTYTLYRSSVAVKDARFHIATFDANEDESYNRENCETASRLFQAQEGVKVKFWCEKGRYRK